MAKAKPLSSATKKTLREKAKKANMTYGELSVVAVGRKAKAHIEQSWPQGVPMAAWAMGRSAANSYIRGDKARTADKDIYVTASL